MATWTSTTHSIADIKEWADNSKLLIRPTYQRNTIWNDAAKIMLIDSILKNIPIPKIFLAKDLDGTKSIRKVIDGQQRLTSILSYLRDEFSLDSPYAGDHKGLKYSELPKPIQLHILQYNIDINEFVNPSEREEREIYSRINKYTMPLNSQELRQAEFPGDFLDLSQEIAELPFWSNYRFFTQSAIRRNLDVEFISETIILLIDGIQDKKKILDNYYFKYSKMKNKDKILKEYKDLLDEIQLLFDGILEYNGDLLYLREGKMLRRTRFSQQADFYSLLHAMQELKKAGGTLKNKDLSYLIEDFFLFDVSIAPEADISVFKDYAVKCISQANSSSSRKWRSIFLRDALNGTMKALPTTDNYIKMIYDIRASNEVTCPSVLDDPITEECFQFWHGKYTGWANNNMFHLSTLDVYLSKPSETEYTFLEIDKI